MQLIKKLMASLMVITLVNSALAMEMEDDRQDELNRRLRAAAGNTASLYINHNPSEVNVLLAQGANPDCKFYFNKEPILITAVKAYGTANKLITLKIVKALLNNDVNLNAQDAEGNTALHYAIQIKWMSMIKILISASADPYIRNKEDISAADLLRAWINETEAAGDPEGRLNELNRFMDMMPIR